MIFCPLDEIPADVEYWREYNHGVIGKEGSNVELWRKRGVTVAKDDHNHL